MAWPTGVRLPRDDAPERCDAWLRPPRADDALLREDDELLREEPLDPPRLDDAPRPDVDPPRADPPVFFAALPRDCVALLLVAAPRPELLRPRVLALLVLRVRVAFMGCVSPLVWPRDGRGPVTQTPCRRSAGYQRRVCTTRVLSHRQRRDSPTNCL